MKKTLVLLTLLAGAAITASCITPTIGVSSASTEVTTYLVLSSVGTYSGSETPKDIPELYLENTIEYVAAPNTALPGADKVGTIDDSEGVFVSWVSYEGTGAPTKYTKVPEESGKILYAFFNRDNSANKYLTDLSYTGTLEKTTYDLDAGDTFDSTGITVTAKFSDDSVSDVTSKVEWSELKVGATTITGSYTFKGVTKSITIDGLTVTGTEKEEKIYLNGNIWDIDGAWFAAYCWNGSSNEFYTLENESGTNYYGAAIDTEKYNNIIFLRMSPSASEPSWTDGEKWNQTVDLTIDGNLFTVTDWDGPQGKSVGSWSTIDL